MHGLDEPPATSPGSPGGRLFEYDLDDLAEVGVRLPIEQVHLLEQCIDGPKSWAMTVTPVIDPEDRYRLVLPLIAWDVVEEEPRLIFYPRVVEIDWSEMQDADIYRSTLAREYNWRRYPSLPGRARQITSWGECDSGAYESFRIWDLWPLDEALIGRLEDSVEKWLESDAYVQMKDYYDVGNGDWDFCDYAEYLGAGEPDSHQHVEETQYKNWTHERCITGEQEFERLQRAVSVYVNDVHYVKWFPGPRFPPPLQEMWEALLLSSHRNTLRAMRAIPPWDRDDIIRSERNYSAWLWLC